MPHTITTTTKDDNVIKMIHRLKARLALANFKRQHGYEKYDLHTLESNLLSINPIRSFSSSLSPSITTSTLLNSYHPYKYYKHRYYPTSKTTHDYISKIKKSNSSSRYHIKKGLIYQSCSLLILKCPPLSEKRSTSPITRPLSLSINDEDAANLLVMLHNRHS
ncbi:unnamed protein product [Cunninghamella blakesleeana]